MRSRRQRRRTAPAASSPLVALVAILALLLQAALPFPVAVAKASAAPAGVPGWLALHLCHADAAKSPSSGTNDEAPAKLPLCPVCLGLQLSGTTLPPSPLALTPPSDATGIRFAGSASEAPASAHRALAQARAPPSIL
ncbi:MAG: hypothetical protein JO255_12765 [Alphaproteobacteria bacterium]|nr:hypothetical protein [Alphaproteobacteria bacterium]